MSTTEFKLVGVWRLRQALRDERRLALAEVLSAQLQMADALARVTSELEELQGRRRQVVGQGVLRLQKLQDDLQVEALLRAERQSYHERAVQLEQTLHQRQDELREAEVEWQAVEWLRQRQS